MSTKDIDINKVPHYTDEELELFVGAYNTCDVYGNTITLDKIRNWCTDDGILHMTLLIPYEELPLYIDNIDYLRLTNKYVLDKDTVFSRKAKEWYNTCISVRLKIGR